MSFTHERAMVFTGVGWRDFTDGWLRSRSLMRRELYIGEGFNPAGPLVVIVFSLASAHLFVVFWRTLLTVSRQRSAC